MMHQHQRAEAAVREETIRTSMTKVIQDQTAPEAVRELAVEVLHWRLRDRLPRVDDDATVRIRPSSA